MAYKHELNKKIKKSGRKRIWVSDQLNMSRTTFWRKVNDNTLTDKEKSMIELLLS